MIVGSKELYLKAKLGGYAVGAFNVSTPEAIHAVLEAATELNSPVVIETSEGDVIAVRHKMYLSLSYDHRVVDGMLGGQFLYAIKDYLENWKE